MYKREIPYQKGKKEQSNLVLKLTTGAGGSKMASV